jgi:hypothetical protein
VPFPISAQQSFVFMSIKLAWSPLHGVARCDIVKQIKLKRIEWFIVVIHQLFVSIILIFYSHRKKRSDQIMARLLPYLHSRNLTAH